MTLSEGLCVIFTFLTFPFILAPQVIVPFSEKVDYPLSLGERLGKGLSGTERTSEFGSQG